MTRGQSGEPFRLTDKKTVVRDHESANALFDELGKDRLEIVLNTGANN